MKIPTDDRCHLLNLLLLGFCASMAANQAGAADRLLLRNGFEISGDVESRGSRITVRSEGRSINFSARQLLRPEPGTEDEPPVRLTLTQEVATRGQQVDSVPELIRVTPFDEFGRRTVVVRGPKNRELPTYQGITELYPTHYVTEGLNRVWKLTLPLSQLPSDQLLPILKTATDSQSPPEQLKVILFLIQAGRFAEAKEHLRYSREQHPSLAGSLEELEVKLNVAVGERGLLLAEKAWSTGQLAHLQRLLTALEPSLPPELQDRHQSLGAQLKETEEKLTEGRSLVAARGAEVPAIVSDWLDREDKEAAEEVPNGKELGDLLDAAFLELSENLSAATIGRVSLALELTGQTPAEQAALLISGWVLGKELAHRDLTRACREWEAWSHLRTIAWGVDELGFQEILTGMGRWQETPGILLAMLPELPAPRPSSNEEIQSFSLALPEMGDLECLVYLPPEYDRYRAYPTLITLHTQTNEPREQIERWRDVANENGFILIAPEYRKERSRPYSYSVAEHAAFLAILAEAKRRYAMDDDRVFLSGHQTGAFAAWDLGMSHPDLFAGLIPIGGAPMHYDKLYWPNLKHLPVYAVDGDSNGTVPEMNREQFTRYFQQGLDAIYVEYPGRGSGPFTEELPTIARWMSGLRRTVMPREVEAVTARYSDRRFYWVVADGFLPNATVAPELFGRSKLRAAKLSASVSDNNTIQISPNGLTSLDILLSPKLVHLDDPRLTIRVHRKVVHQGALEPDLETMLRHFRETLDAKNPVVKVIRASNF